MMRRFSQEAWENTAPLRRMIRELPFNRELAAGTLARERFQGYITQDALYLGEFSRALALAAAKAPDAQTSASLANSAAEAIAVERALHERYLAEFGVDPASLAQAEPSPDCLAYTSFLVATLYRAPWGIGMAALLPCFWIYWEEGCAIAGAAAPENPYRAWIDTYADPHFGEVVKGIIAMTDGAARNASRALRDEMFAAFRRAVQYEWLFWDGAYRRRGWPDARTP
jgi:thiaminase (transcriptional activator TenA)